MIQLMIIPFRVWKLCFEIAFFNPSLAIIDHWFEVFDAAFDINYGDQPGIYAGLTFMGIDLVSFSIEW